MNEGTWFKNNSNAPSVFQCTIGELLMALIALIVFVVFMAAMISYATGDGISISSIINMLKEIFRIGG